MSDKKPIAVAAADAKKKPSSGARGASSEKSAEHGDGLSDDDRRIKEEVELLVTRCQDHSHPLALIAVETLSGMLRTATGTVASVPKPLKYVREHYATLVAYANTTFAAGPSAEAPQLGPLMFDMLAFISMTIESQDPREPLILKLRGPADSLVSWGHEFMRFMAGLIASVWNGTITTQLDGTSPLPAWQFNAERDLLPLCQQIIHFMVGHQDEAVACDLALDIGRPEILLTICDAANFQRLGQYLLAISRYLPAPEAIRLQELVFQINMDHQAWPQALRIALLLQDEPRAVKVFSACPDDAGKKQLAFIAGRSRMPLATGDGDLDDLIGNMKIAELFQYCARDLDSMAPKTPEDVFREHLMDKRNIPVSTAETAFLHTLAHSMVNGLVNAGFGTDTHLTSETGGIAYIAQTKDHRMLTAAATLGLVHLWDLDQGLGKVDKYTYSDNDSVKGGALMATGMLLTSIRSQFDPAFGLLSSHVASPSREVRIGAIMGLAFAYAGTRNADTKDLLIPFVADSSQPLDVQCIAAFALGTVFSGSCDNDVGEVIMIALMEKDEKVLQDPVVRYLILALGLLFLRRQDAADAVLEASKTLHPSVARYTEAILLMCAYAGTGNVVIVQRLLTAIAEREDTEVADAEKKATTAAAAPAAAAGADAAPASDAAAAPNALSHKAAAVLAVGVIAMGEELGADMAKRTALHILLSKEAPATSGRRAVPLALAMLSVSNPQLSIVDSLSKLSHDSDAATAMSATLGLGLVAAGSNHARVTSMLRSLTGYYARDKEGGLVFLSRFAQGLTAMGKGHITLSPTNSGGLLFSSPALCGLLALGVSGLDFQGTVLGKYSFMLHTVALAAAPRMLVAVDETLAPVKTQLRVGTPVDTVTLVGKPKSITGFQTHNSPVLLQSTDRAEIAPGKLYSLTPVVEGVVVLAKKATGGDDAAEAS